MSTNLGPLVSTTIFCAPASLMPDVGSPLVAPASIQAFPFERSAQLGLPTPRAGVELWRDCAVEGDHPYDIDGCSCGLPAWATEELMLADCAAHAILPTAVVDVAVDGPAALHMRGIRAAGLTARTARLTPWCVECREAGWWRRGLPVVSGEGPQGGEVLILCGTHAGGRPAVALEALSEWLDLPVLTATSALARQLRRHFPGPTDIPGSPVPACANRTVAGLRMGQRGFVSADDLALTDGGGVVVLRGARAPQVPRVEGPVIPVKRDVDLSLKAFPDAAALDALIQRGTVDLGGPVSPVHLALPINAVEAARPRPSRRHA